MSFMYSHRVQTRSFACAAAAPVSSWTYSCRRPCAALRARRRKFLAKVQNTPRPKNSRIVVITALWGSSGSQEQPWNKVTDRRQAFLNFIQHADPTIVNKIDIPAPVIQAMRQTITSMLGTLPPSFFTITISAKTENFAQLMLSVLMTGYMFRSAWTRMNLSRSLESISSFTTSDSTDTSSSSSSTSELALSSSSSLPASSSLVRVGSTAVQDIEQWEIEVVEGGYAPGSQKLEIEGRVLRWHHERGAEAVPALQYIEALEEEVGRLKRQMMMNNREEGNNNGRGRGDDSNNDDDDNGGAIPASSSFSNTTATANGLYMNSNAFLGGNELLDWLRLLPEESLAELTDNASDDVLEAMNSFVQILMIRDAGVSGRGGKEEADCSASEMAKLLYWLMAVGWQLRWMEERLCLALLPETTGEDGPTLLGPGR